MHDFCKSFFEVPLWRHLEFRTGLSSLTFPTSGNPSSLSQERENERGWPFPILHPCRISHSLTSTLHLIHIMHFKFGDNLLLSTFVRSLSFNLPSAYYACIIILIILWFLQFTKLVFELWIDSIDSLMTIISSIITPKNYACIVCTGEVEPKRSDKCG